MGKIEEYLLKQISECGAIHLSLLDPVNTPIASVPQIIYDVVTCGSSGIMVGGSTLVDSQALRDFISEIKRNTDLPVILFPNNVSSIVPNVDAVWFMSLLNSRNPYYIVGAQMLAAPLVKKYGLEAIPMGYLILGEGGVAGFIGDANPIPFNKPEITVAYALAGQYLGLRFIYLEAGSGVEVPIPPSLISAVKENVPGVTLIAGGGVRTGETAFQMVKAGADIIVTGTVVEDKNLRAKKLREIIVSIKKAGKLR